MMREVDQMAIEASKDRAKMEDFIKNNESFIIKTASKTLNKFITKSDDEWSIALIAFAEAVESYSFSKGSFLSFAKLVIKRRLIDYIKSNTNGKNEILASPNLFDGESEENAKDISLKVQITKKTSYGVNENIKHEIQAISEVFNEFGFSFLDLASNSPKSKKTKNNCAKAVNFILENPIVLNELNETKRLNMKIIEKNTKIPRKILDRHRKYIIAAVMILSGEYQELAEYFRYIRKEN